MKKVMMLLLCALMCLGILGACKNTEEKEIVLSFGQQEAYFTGNKKLMPIKGTVPVETDIFETAVIKVSANEMTKMRLVAEFDAGGEIANLMIRIGSGDAQAFIANTVIYESAAAEKNAEISVAIFLAKNALAEESADKQLTFSLKLEYFSE